MSHIGQSNDKPNPKAPAEQSQFAFLIGHWRFDAKFKSPQGDWQTFHGTWIGRYILDGYAIVDEYKMQGSGGEVLVHGMNFRVYDAVKRFWNIKWLNALDGTWMDLTSDEFGGAQIDGQSVSYTFRELSELPADGWRRTAKRHTPASRRHFSPGAATSLLTERPGQNSCSLSAIGFKVRQSRVDGELYA